MCFGGGTAASVRQRFFGTLLRCLTMNYGRGASAVCPSQMTQNNTEIRYLNCGLIRVDSRRASAI